VLGGAGTEWDYGTHMLLYVEGGNEAVVMSPCLQPLTLGSGNVMVAPLMIHGGDEGS
jgi:hypothetical protein